MEERRRSPRRDVHGEFATVPAVLNVRVIDISIAGVLLQSSHVVQPGTRGALRLNLDGVSFRATVEIQRVATHLDDGAGYRLGATFVGLDPDLQHMIERYMTQ